MFALSPWRTPAKRNRILAVKARSRRSDGFSLMRSAAARPHLRITLRPCSEFAYSRLEAILLALASSVLRSSYSRFLRTGSLFLVRFLSPNFLYCSALRPLQRSHNLYGTNSCRPLYQRLPKGPTAWQLGWAHFMSQNRTRSHTQPQIWRSYLISNRLLAPPQSMRMSTRS